LHLSLDRGGPSRGKISRVGPMNWNTAHSD
jgi:hypothetical protein